MLDSPLVRLLASRVPAFFTGRQLHRAGLAAFHAREYATADFLLEHAADRYREDLEMEALARVRTHQLIMRAHTTPGHGTADALEVDRRLSRLERIEALAPPFTPVPAHELIARWRVPSRALVGRDPALDRAA
jgi:hypothetical protein